MNEQRYAVLIASSQYPQEPKLQDLCCPENDVNGLKKLLSSKTYGNFDKTHVLVNKPHYEVLIKINQVLKDARKEDMVLLYYSGHGKLDPAGRLHLATTNTSLNTLEATSIPVESIRNFIDISPSNKVVLILDCCFSGAAGTAFSRGSVDEQLQSASSGRGTYILTASTGIQLAMEKEADKYGVLTKHIIEGIQNGEADLNEDGFIDMDELYNYVHHQVKNDGCQEPMKWDLNVRGELIISQSGKSPREDRCNEIRDMLLDLAKVGDLPNSILIEAMKILDLNKDQLSETLENYDLLLERLHQKKIKLGRFTEEWFKVELKPIPAATPTISTATPPESKDMFCPKCGKANDKQAGFCKACGANLQTSTTISYASFWKRAVASLIDGVLLFVAAWIIVGILDGVFDFRMHVFRFHAHDNAFVLIYSLVFWGGWLYYAKMESSAKQATIGKKAVKLMVTDLQGNRISFGKATGRYFGKIISALIAYIGFIMAAFTKKKQALHDIMAGCLVVKEKTTGSNNP